MHNPVGYRITPPVATLNSHPIANAVSEWDANDHISDGGGLREMTPDGRKTEHLCGMAVLGANRDQLKAVGACPRGAKIEREAVFGLRSVFYSTGV